MCRLMPGPRNWKNYSCGSDRFGRVDLRQRRRAYVQGLIGPVGRKNSRQLAEHAGHRTPTGLQHLLGRACWDPDEVYGDLQEHVAEKLGDPAGALIIDDMVANSRSPWILAARQRSLSDIQGLGVTPRTVQTLWLSAGCPVVVCRCRAESGFRRCR
jgi:hypothetical protein